MATSSDASCFASDDPARRSRVRPRPEIEARRSEKKALLLMSGANPNQAELLHGFMAEPITIKRVCGAKNVMPRQKNVMPAVRLAAGEARRHPHRAVWQQQPASLPPRHLHCAPRGLYT